MRLLLVSHVYDPEMGAAPIRLLNMVEGLAHEGFEVDVLTALPNYPKGRIFDGYKGRFCMVEKKPYGHIYRYWLIPDNSLNKVKRLISILTLAINFNFFGWRIRRCCSYDAVIVQTPQLISAFSAVVMMHKWYRKKIILNVSDIHPNSKEDGGSFDKNSLSYKWQKWIEQFLYRNTVLLIGQSDEIIKHVNEYRKVDSIVYRNLQSMEGNSIVPKIKRGNKLVYAGLLSKTQGVLKIIQNIDFASLGLEMHIYGEGNERIAIEAICDNKYVFYHGTIPNNQMFAELQKYDASIVPLAKALKGAVPSKIYNVVAAGMPIFFIGKEDGEASNLVHRYKIGWISAIGDYERLNANLLAFSKMSDEDYLTVVGRCLHLSENEFNYKTQMNRLSNKIKGVLS